MPERLIATAPLALASTAALAAPPQQTGRMYKCVDANGKTYYTQILPPQCQGSNTKEISRQGRVVKENEVLSAEQIAAREAEKKKKAEAEKLAGEERRRNTALLNTYSSEKDIEDARKGALQQAAAAIKASEARIADGQKRLAGFEKEKEFFVKKPLPPRLEQDMQNTERDIKKDQEIIEARKKELSAINAKYDEDRRRYLELTRTRK